MNKFGTLTKKKKTPAPEEQAPPQPQQTEEDEAEQIDREGREAIDSSLVLHQPDLRLLEDGEYV